MANPSPFMRVRVRLSRRPPASGLSHLRQIETIRRGLRESSWPLYFGEGGKKKPRASFGPSIAEGYESDSEFAEVELAERLNWETALADLSKNLPPSLKPLEVNSIPVRFPSLEKASNVAEWLLKGPVLAASEEKWKEFEALGSFKVEKKKKDGSVFVDARPLVKSWRLEGDELRLTLRFGPGRTVKPERLAHAVCGGAVEKFDPASPESGFIVRRVSLGFETKNGEVWPL